MIFDKFGWPFAESFPLTATAWRRAIVQFIRDNALAFTLDKTWTDASLEFDLEQESPSMQEMLDGIDCRKRKTGVDTAQFQGRGLAADGVWMGWSVAEYCSEHLQTVVHSKHKFSRWNPRLREVVHARIQRLGWQEEIALHVSKSTLC